MSREDERHSKVLETIKNATRKEDLPNVTISNITRYLANNVYFDDNHLGQTTFKPIVDAILKHNFFVMPEVKEVFMDIVKENYPGKTEEEYEEKYNQIASTPVISDYLIEISERSAKLKEFEEQNDLEEHNWVLKEIKNANEISELPKVGRGTLNRRIQDNTVSDFSKRVPMARLEDLTEGIFQGKTKEEIENIVLEICRQENLDEEQTNLMFDQVTYQLFTDKKIGYLVEEVKEKDKRVSEIYKLEHEETMENIKNAKRISQLPPNLTISTLTSYLSGNTTIYPRGEKISSIALQNLSQMLLEGKNFGEEDVQGELKKVAKQYYPEKAEEAYDLLSKKLSELPKTNYLREEINYSQERQKEFIGRRCSNVNVYFVPNPKSPIEGGRFYNCYINRVQNLDLGQLLPLDLKGLVPDEMDVDSIEWYIQENYDDTFKAAGGIILNKDETIGNVSVFQPSEGKIGITPEQKNKYEELEELSKQVKDIIKSKNARSKRFEELQKAYLEYQKETDDQLTELEAKIDAIMQKGDEER